MTTKYYYYEGMEIWYCIATSWKDANKQWKEHCDAEELNYDDFDRKFCSTKKPTEIY